MKRVLMLEKERAHRQDGHINMEVGLESLRVKNVRSQEKDVRLSPSHCLQGTVTAETSLLISGLWKKRFLLISDQFGGILFQHLQL